MKKIALILGSWFLMLGILQAQNCPRYIDGDSIKTTPAYSIYREFFKKNLYGDAFPQWRNMYANAPGFRKQTFIDGGVMYTNLIQTTTDNTLRQQYIDTLFMIYDNQIKCHGEDEYVLGKKAIDLLKYGKNADIPQARKFLEQSIQISGDKAFPYYIQTYFKLLINQNGVGDITPDFIKLKYDELTAVIDKNIAKPDNKQLQAYKEVKTLIDDLYTQNFADKSDPSDCAKLLEIYLKKYNANPNDPDVVRTVYTKTKGCADSSLNVEFLKKLNQLDPNYSYAIRLGSIYMKNNQFDEAYVLYENAVAKEKDSSKRADLYYIMASLKADKNDFAASREMARLALTLNPNLGKAYLLIGTLYAASGKLCGPGTGFQSQIVLWPAFDYFRKAIEVGTDDTKTEAQKMISTYTQYLPTKAEITAKKLKAGAPYTIGCWINEATTVQVKSGGGAPGVEKKN
ncbi:MAG: hypothetical protein IPM95_15875 [Sphingobacteriales bacterium]|jgi:tetratricopeptide (TPR) repeat protein|nr:hypothetical protein [Sphingobacteriales bacterium]